MNKVLETHKLPKLYCEEIENLSRPITSKVIESIIKNFSKKKSLGSDGITGDLYQTKKNSYQDSSNSLKNLKWREHFQTHSMRAA